MYIYSRIFVTFNMFSAYKMSDDPSPNSEYDNLYIDFTLSNDPCFDINQINESG